MTEEMFARLGRDEELVEVEYPGDRTEMEDPFKYIKVRDGDGKTKPQKGDIVTIHYKGSFKDSQEEFDSTYRRG